jgi:hypothetical protein
LVPDEFFEFVVLVTEDPFGPKRLSKKFAQFLTGREPTMVHLWEASCGFCRWPNEVLFNVKGLMFLHTG